MVMVERMVDVRVRVVSIVVVRALLPSVMVLVTWHRLVYVFGILVTIVVYFWYGGGGCPMLLLLTAATMLELGPPLGYTVSVT